MIVQIAIGCVLLFTVWVFFSKHIYYTIKQKKAMIIILAFAMAALAFSADPPSGADLYRHLRWMDNLRASNLSFFQFVFNNPLQVGGYQTLISFNILRYVICKFTDNSHWLPCFCAFIDYLILGYIAFDWYESSKVKERMGLLTALLSAALYSCVGVFSGIRTSFAFAIIGLAVYLYIYKGKGIILFAILTFIAATIHEAALMAVPFVLLSKMDIGKKGLFVVIMISFLTDVIVRILATFHVRFLTIIVNKFYYYTQEYENVMTLGHMGSRILVIAFLGLYLFLADAFEKMYWNKSQKRLYMFLIYLICFMIGNIRNINFFGRPCALLGVYAPLLSSFVVNKEIWIKKRGTGLQMIGKILCSINCILMVYSHIRIVFPYFK